MTKPLTVAAVEKMRPEEARREIPDGGCPGLFLVIQPSGSKSWALRFRRPDGSPAKLTLGTVHVANDREPDIAPAVGGHLTLRAAHRLVGELRHEIAQGRDPAASYLAQKERRRIEALDRSANTFGGAAKDFIERYAMKNVRRWKEQAHLLGFKPAADGLQIIPKGVADRWAKKPLVEITSDDIEELIDETRRHGAPGLERRSDGPTESRARAMLSCLSTMFDWLRDRPKSERKIAANPCAGIKRPDTPEARDRVLTNSEVAKFWTATQHLTMPFGPILRMLLLTGCRLNEVAGMRADELEDGKWTIPSARTKNGKPHVVDLPPLARDLIDRTPRVEGSPFIFTTTGRSPVSGWSKVKVALDKAMKLPASAEPWRIHDLRRTAATGMAGIGIAPHIVEAALNHISGAKAGVAGTYNRAAYAEEKRLAFAAWAAHVERIVSDKG